MTFSIRFLLLSLLLTPSFLLAQSPATKAPVESSEARVIRALRAESNQAIQRRDLIAFGRTMLPDIEVTRGSSSHVSGRDSVLASVSVQFNDAAFLGYVRYTDRIEVSTMSPLAAEHGHWMGRFQRTDGIQIITGTYLAMWRKTDAGWKIRSELFVSLACIGSTACGN